MYKLLPMTPMGRVECVLEVATGKQIPMHESCLDFRRYEAWLAAGNTPEPADVLPQPSPIEAIRAIERSAAVADAMQRAGRLVALAYALDDLIRIATSKGQTVTRTQAHDWAMANDPNYRTLYEAEQAIKPLRVLV